ncbi:hypothetical protein DPMN_181525 [Dreissena polymorpha]|uniref:Uncharacterized protein n=1 Tax=Dreissena polymorpha TaxID=45954 RepID=A0A9D4DEA3_DREPO|nr:hypothetical protein DPMN_181525 [Dreissena polymorpha]
MTLTSRVAPAVKSTTLRTDYERAGTNGREVSTESRGRYQCRHQNEGRCEELEDVTSYKEFRETLTKNSSNAAEV